MMTRNGEEIRTRVCLCTNNVMMLLLCLVLVQEGSEMTIGYILRKELSQRIADNTELNRSHLVQL